MATTKITSPDLFNLESLNSALKLPSGTTAQRPTSPSTGEWRYNTTTNLVEFWDGAEWRDLQSEEIPPIPSENFNVVLYTGTGSAQSITGVGFKPDMVWIKDRIQAYSHNITDTSRGTSKQVFPNNTNAQDTTYTNRVTSFDADGFTIGNDNYVNTNGNTFVAWCWKANGGTTSSNADGTQTSTVQVNAKAGFSIVQYTASAAGASETVGHGLGTTPAMIILKRTDNTEDWYVWHKDLGAGSSALNQFLKLNSTSPQATATNLFRTVNSTVFNPSYTNGVPNTNIAYCFAEKAEYSKFGSYIGNGSTNGPIVNTGFEPAYIMIKNSTSTYEWTVYDNKRSTSNPRNNVLYPNTDGAENSGETGDIDFLTNGFQLKAPNGTINHNGGTMIYAAFAADASATPALANSFTTNLYTGNSGTQILGTGFQPSLVWIKDRSATRDHNLTDSVRGVTHPIYITTGAQLTNSTFLTSFNTDGFSLGNQAASNENLEDFVAWCWKANIIPTINTDGTIESQVSANQAAGFSIVSWTSTSSASDTIGHGLSSKPDVVLYKKISDTGSWFWYTDVIDGSWDELVLNSTAAKSDFAGTYATSTTFKSVTSSSGANWITYCFASVAGFSKFGTYAGSGSNVNVVTGFQPSFVLVRNTGVEDWNIMDSARGGDERLFPNTNGAESTTTNACIFNSDGFTIGVTGNASLNNAGDNYIYMAFKNNRGFASAGTMAFTVAAGGGGGGASQGGGLQFQRAGCGGGAGGFRGSGDITGGRCAPQDDINLASGTYTVTVGAGGSPRVSGSASSIAGPSLTTISTVGGGRGADDTNQPENGGSGGGRSFYSSANGYSTACEGYGRTLEGVSSWQAGGGGAGGIQASLGVSNASGIGVSSTMSGTNQFYAGGGAPGSGNTTRPQAAPGGGGNGQISGETAANTPAEITGTANTGGGGGGGSQNTSTGTQGAGGSGGSGIVILRLKTSEYSGTTTGSPTVTTDGDETIIQFTGSGTYVHS